MHRARMMQCAACVGGLRGAAAGGGEGEKAGNQRGKRRDSTHTRASFDVDVPVRSPDARLARAGGSRHRGGQEENLKHDELQLCTVTAVCVNVVIVEAGGPAPFYLSWTEFSKHAAKRAYQAGTGTGAPTYLHTYLPKTLVRHAHGSVRRSFAPFFGRVAAGAHRAAQY